MGHLRNFCFDGVESASVAAWYLIFVFMICKYTSGVDRTIEYGIVRAYIRPVLLILTFYQPPWVSLQSLTTAINKYM